MRDDLNIQSAARLVGVAFLAAGIGGFIPGLTTNLYDGLHFAGHTGDAELLGIFQVSVLHNLVHILFGVAGLALAARPDSARTFLLGGGAIYIALWLYGLIIEKAGDGNFVPLDSADDWLHFGLGVAMLGLGLALSRRREGDLRTATR